MSIAFPLISAGIFGYPVEQAWQKAIQACTDFLEESNEIDIVFAVLDDAIINIGKTALQELKSNRSDEGATHIHPKCTTTSTMINHTHTHTFFLIKAIIVGAKARNL